MATSPVDYLSGLGGLKSLPNSYETMQGVHEDQQNNQIRDQRLQLGMQALAQGQAEQQQQQEYQTAAAAALRDGSPAAISSLITRFPQQHAAIAKGWEIKDTGQKQADLRSAGEVLSALDAGRADLAIASMEARISAEEAAGHDVTQDRQQLSAIKSGDPAAIKATQGALRYTLAAVEPDKFAATLGKVGGSSEKTEGKVVGNTIGHYDDAGKWVVDYTAPEYRSVGTGDSLYQVGGDGPSPSSPPSARHTGEQIEQAVISAIPGAIVTSRARTPEHNAEVGGVPNSRHLTDQARDFVPPKGMPMAQFASLVRQALPGAKLINEGDHVHVQSTGAQGGGGGSRIIAQGAPKPGYSILSPQEVGGIPGLDRNTVYQRSPDGQITAVGGQSKAQLKPLPPKAADAIATNQSSLNEIDQAIALLDPKNKSKAAAAARYSIGTGNRVLPDWVLQQTNPDGTDFRARVGKIGGVIIKDISGAAVSASEDDRLAKWVPSTTDTPDAALAKLRNLRRSVAQTNETLLSTYGEDQGYRPFHATEAAASSPAVRINTPKEWQALAKGTPYIDPKGVRRVKS